MNDLFTRAPHRRHGAGAEETFSNAALLIDFDNVTMGTRSNLGQELRRLLNSDIIKGKVAVQRAYADWRRYPQYIVSLSEASIDLIFAPAYGSSKKNATDIRLAIDALELVFTRPEIGTFILLSGDSDFSSLVLKLKEYGKYVIGVGMQESSSDLLVQNCDEYYSYNSISGLTSAADGPTEKHDPWVLAARTIQKMEERKDVMRSDRFKQVMLELDPSFDEKEIGFSKFNRFLTEAASRGILSLEKAANGQYEVASGSRVTAIASGDDSGAETGGGAEAAPAAAPEKRSRSRTRSRRSQDRKSQQRREAPPAEDEAPRVDENRLRAAYTLLADVTAELSRPGSPVRDSEVKRRMLETDGKFDEAALGFRKFSRFLRQAHDEGIVDLERGPEGNYLVSPINGSETATSGARAASKDDADTSATSERRGRGRRSRSEKSDRGPKRDRERDRSSGPADRADAAASDEAPRSDGGAPAGPAEEPPTPDERPAATAEPPSATAEQADRARAPGMGRFRRGSRSRSSAPAKRSATVPGPVDEPAADAVTSGPEAETAKDEPAAAPDPEPTRRAVAGRARRGGGRSRGEESTRRASAGSNAGVANGEAQAAQSSKYRAEIEAMSRNYPGVGRRTADVLFREFGDRVYQVIDEQPDRIRAVLPEHRARAVLAGRQAERESQDGRS